MKKLTRSFILFGDPIVNKEIQINKVYKNNGRTRAMPDYAIPISLYEEIVGEDYIPYKDHEEDCLYNIWDIQNGETLVYSKIRFLHYMELME